MRTIIFSIILAVYVAANVYVCARICALLPATGRASLLKYVVAAIIGLGVVGIPLFFVFRDKMGFALASFLYGWSTSWMIALAYFLIIFLLIDFGRLLNSFLHFANPDTLKGLLTNNWISATVIVGTVAVLLLGGNINYHNKRRVHLNVASNKLSAQSSPMRVVAISDLHLGYTISTDELRRWVDMINAEKPDLVVIGGDLIDNSVKPVLEQNLDAELRRLAAPMGVYACSGNHEFISGIEAGGDFMKQAGIVFLRDSVVNLKGISIVGRDDHSNKRRKAAGELLGHVSAGNFSILLDHQPQNLADAEGFDFQFSGHTHRGQVFPFSLIADKIFELSHGHLTKGNTHYYVSSGLGIWGGKFRIGTVSEYVVIDLHGNDMSVAN